MSHARRLLLAGAAAADVAARCGFADQSHFTRHFKRFNGVTPIQYALGQRAALRRQVGGPLRGDPSALVARSDR